jgi:hypothetical protein
MPGVRLRGLREDPAGLLRPWESPHVGRRGGLTGPGPGGGLGDMSGQVAADLMERIGREVSARAGRNRFVDLVEAGRVPRERLAWLAGEEFCIVGSAYVAWNALFGTCSAVALAMLANLQEWGGCCDRVAAALVTRYGLAERDVAFFRFFAAPPPGFADQAAQAAAAGLAAGDDPRQAVRAALALHAYETAFWDTLADGLD